MEGSGVGPWLGTVIADGTVENVFGPAGLAEQVADSSQTSQFASADAVGSIGLITDASGAVVGTGSYTAWGTPESGAVTLGGFGFTGEQVDPETGFVYLRNRYLDPTTSRFLTPDPLGLPGSGVNLYVYAHNNPVVRVDPSGKQDDFAEEFDGYAGGPGGAGGGGGEAASPGGAGEGAGSGGGPNGGSTEPSGGDQGKNVGPASPVRPVGAASIGPNVGEGKFPCTESEAGAGGDPADKWATPGAFWDHYWGHGVEMGLSATEYADAALTFFQEAEEQELPTIERGDGDLVIANFDTGEFGVYTQDGEPITYYMVDPLDIEREFYRTVGTQIR